MFDRHTVFADKLLLPRILLPLDDRVIIGETNTDDLYMYRDRDGDGVAEEKTQWFAGGPRWHTPSSATARRTNVPPVLGMCRKTALRRRR